MNTFTTAKFVLISVVCVSISASAACGGGGWHKSSRSETVAVVDSTPVVRSSDSQNVSYSKSSDRAADRISLNTSRFDSVSAQMQLSDRQLRDVRDAENDIRDKANSLSDAKARAESKYARCTGNCDKERRNLDQANSAFNDFSPNKEFDRRLSSILNDRQMTVYKNADKR